MNFPMLLARLGRLPDQGKVQRTPSMLTLFVDERINYTSRLCR
jgi:hypothetical protein